MKSLFKMIFVAWSLFVLTFGAFAQMDEIPCSKGQLLPAVPAVGIMDPITNNVYSYDFNASRTGVSMTGGWALASGQRETGQVAAVGLPESYENLQLADLTLSDVVLPALSDSVTGIRMRFAEWFELESGFDNGRILVSGDDGTMWTELDRRNGFSDWRTATVDLSPFAGQTVQIRFELVTDSTITYGGWQVDDVQIVSVGRTALAVTMVSLSSQNFPFIYLNVNVARNGSAVLTLDDPNFQVTENSTLQTNFFDVTPPSTGGGVRLADIVFCVDNSGSMGDDQANIRNNMISFVNSLVTAGVDFGLGLLRFGAATNSGWPIVQDGGVLTSDANYFKNTVWLRNTVDGGTEPGWDALYTAANSYSFRPGAQRILVLVTDEDITYSPNPYNHTQAQVISLLQTQTATAFCVIRQSWGSSVSNYCPIATATNGVCFDITQPWNQIFDYISNLATATYVVSYQSSNPLNDGILRHVVVNVTDGGDAGSCSGDYTPGSAPQITRTQATIDLHLHSWVEGTAFDIAVNVVDNAPPPVQAVTLFYRHTTDASYSTAAMSLVSGNTYHAVIPGTAVRRNGLDYYITATDGQTTSSAPTTDPRNHPYQLAILPNIAPQITHTTGCSFTPGSPYPISAEVVDNTNQVQSVDVKYRRYGALSYTSSPLTLASGNTYTGQIPAAFVTTTGFQYYLEARDDLGISGYFGSADDPLTVGNWQNFVNAKRSTIQFFNARSFYTTAEADASSYTNSVEAHIQAGTADCKEIEALRRLLLVEYAAQEAYPGAVNLANIGSNATVQVAITSFFLVALKKILDVVRIPGLSDANQSFTQYIQHLRNKFVPQMGNRLGAYLVRHGIAEGQSLGWRAAHGTFTLAQDGCEQLAQAGLENLAGANSPGGPVANMYLGLYENGSGTTLRDANTKARLEDFTEGTTDGIDITLRQNEIPRLSDENQQAAQEAELAMSAGDWLGWIALAVIAIVALAAAIAALPGCVTAIGCIVAFAAGALSLGSTYVLISNAFSVGQIVFYTTAMGISLNRLEGTLPGDLSDIEGVAFSDGRGALPTYQSPVPAWTVPVAELPVRWTDSLSVYSTSMAQHFSAVRAFMLLGDWNHADSIMDIVHVDLPKFWKQDDIVSSILRVAYSHHDSTAPPEIDSVFTYALAHSAANAAALGLTSFALTCALEVHPTGGQLDTLAMILDTCAQRLEDLGPVYQDAFDLFNSWNVLAPPVVAITYNDVKKSGTGFIVEAKIHNTSSAPVHNVSSALTDIDSLGITIQPQTATDFPQLNGDEERTLRWRLLPIGADSLFHLQLEVKPSVVPGDFEGDLNILSAIRTISASDFCNANTNVSYRASGLASPTLVGRYLTQTGLVLNWTKTPGVDFYRVYRAASYADSMIAVGFTRDTTWTDTTVLVRDDPKQYYEVRAFRTALRSANPTGETGYWPMEEGTGESTEDASGNAHTAQLHDADWITYEHEGYSCNALHFGNLKWASAPNADAFYGGTWQLDLELRLESLPTTSAYTIISNARYSTVFGGFALRVEPGGYLRAQVCYENQWQSMLAVAPLPVGQWVQVSLIINGDQSMLVVNDVIVAMGEIEYNPANNNMPLTIGAAALPNGTHQYFLRGDIAWMRWRTL